MEGRKRGREKREERKREGIREKEERMHISKATSLSPPPKGEGHNFSPSKESISSFPPPPTRLERGEHIPPPKKKRGEDTYSLP